jgi:hypothetical protein
MREAMSTATDIAVLAGRVAKDERVWRNISRHDRACAYKSKLSNGHTAENDGTGANRGTVLYQGRCNFPVIGAFQLAIRGDSAGKKVVGEANMRPHENAVFKCDAFKNGDVILNLDTRADMYMGIDVNTFANITCVADLCVLAYLGLAPDACASSYMGFG